MKPAPFEYLRARSVDEAVAALSAQAGEAKIIAGGQSLVPMLNFRLLRPTLLIDINGIEDLKFLDETPGGGLRIGALTRHHTLETSPLVQRLFPVLSEAMAHVAHLAIRNRGTIGGSLSHADPAAELPLLAVLLDARIRTASPSGGRTIAAAELFVAALSTCLEQAEIIVEVELPALTPATGWAFEEISRRSGDFALAAVGVLLTVSDGRVNSARIGMIGVGETPMRATGAEALIKGRAVDAGLLDELAAVVMKAVEPHPDLHASAEYRRHLVGVLLRRSVAVAWRRAQGEIHD